MTKKEQHQQIICYLLWHLPKVTPPDSFGYVHFPFMKRTEKYLPKLEKALSVFLEALGMATMPLRNMKSPPIEIDDIRHIVAGDTYHETYGAIDGFKELKQIIDEVCTVVSDASGNGYDGTSEKTK